MSANAVVSARIDEHIKEEATAVLAAMGLTVSEAFSIMLTRVAHDKLLPFEPLVPNATTIAAMKEAPWGLDMVPTAAVSGLYFSHPDARYFAVGEIGRDQVVDYAERKGMDLAAMELWLAPYLAYELSNP